MPKIKAILFDMDGTILDTEKIHKICWEKAMGEIGIKYTPHTFYNLIGLNDESTGDYLKNFFGITNEEYKEMSANAYSYAENYASESGIPVKKGFFDLSEYISSKGLKTAIVTSSICRVAENNFKLAGINYPFDAIIGGDCVTKGKPNPEPYERAAEAVGIPNVECLAVEDSANGIKSAHDAGIKCVYIKDMADISEDVKALADFEAESLDGVIEIIDRIDAS